MIPGFFISLLTFPGVIVHEFAHALFCRLTKTEVHEVCYFQLKNPVGYVVHEVPGNVWHHILIDVGPFIVNSIIGFVLGVINVLLHFNPKNITPVSGLIEWLAISVAIHAFPSTTDAKNIWQAVWNKDAPIAARIVGTPLVIIIYIGAIGSAFWLDLVYGISIVYWLPKMLHL